MIDPTAEFFEELGRSGHQPLLKKAIGTLRFELRDGARTEHWFVNMEKGDVSVSRTGADADCVARTDKRVFDRLVSGNQNAMATLLRGELRVEGDGELMVLFQRLFPAPPRAS